MPVDITELLDRAAHDATAIYPDLDVSLAPSPTCIIVGLPAGLRLAVDNAIANAVKHGGATSVQLSAVSSRAGVEIAIDAYAADYPEADVKWVFERFSRLDRVALGLGLALWCRRAGSRRTCTAARRALEESPLAATSAAAAAAAEPTSPLSAESAALGRCSRRFREHNDSQCACA